ncbi:MAG TPA: aminopeptidase [Verrucomicrobiales bacterium]|jgi:predicted aminopeptidase|nr:aminopeptidase [Verrucomicrobiales bacterium]
MLSPLFQLTVLFALAAALSSCRTVSFYAQAWRGQRQILTEAKPIARVLKDPSTSEAVRKKLELVLELRKFAAEELLLPADKQYDHYCDLKRKYVVWVVYAAPEFSVEGKTWWYPLVGSLKYRGFFSEENAKHEAAELKANGYDVYLAGTEGYSTLGYLRDPVLNTFLHRSDAELAELIFHELTHQGLYLSGDTDFNEALATAVGEEGAVRWLKAKGRTKELKAYQAQRQLQRQIVRIVLDTRARLKDLYARHAGDPPEKLRALKTAEFEHMRAEGRRLRKQSTGKPDLRRPSKPGNNATLNSIAAYYTLLPAFERMIREEHGDLERFYRRVEAMKPMTKEERRQALGKL